MLGVPTHFEGVTLRTIVIYKWRRIGRPIFVARFAAYGLFVLLFSVLCLEYDGWVAQRGTRAMGQILWGVAAAQVVLLAST